MFRILNMSEFWIFQDCHYAKNFQVYKGFTYFHKYDRVLSMRWDAIMEDTWIFQDSEYPRFLDMLNNAWTNGSDCDRVCWVWLVKALQDFGYASDSKYARDQIWQGCKYARITQSTEYAWISGNNNSLCIKMP